jgi:triphosphatase
MASSPGSVVPLPDAPAVRKATIPPLSPHDDLRRTLRLLLGEGLEQFHGNEPAARAGQPEGVHQMRVALRRLRAVLRLFRGLLNPELDDRYEDGLRALGQLLGEARDWDVFCTEVLPTVAAAEPPGPRPNGPLARAAAVRREAAHVALNAGLDAPHVQALLDGLAHLHERDDAFTVDASQPIADVAADQLAHLEKRVRRRGRKLRHQDDVGRHRLRKALKALRYGREMLQALDEQALEATRPPHGARKAVKGLQEALGGLNDAVAAVELAHRLRPDPAAGPATASLLGSEIAMVERWSATHREEALAALPDGWAQFKEHGLRD